MSTRPYQISLPKLLLSSTGSAEARRFSIGEDGRLRENTGNGYDGFSLLDLSHHQQSLIAASKPVRRTRSATCASRPSGERGSGTVRPSLGTGQTYGVTRGGSVALGVLAEALSRSRSNLQAQDNSSSIID